MQLFFDTPTDPNTDVPKEPDNSLLEQATLLFNLRTQQHEQLSAIAHNHHLEWMETHREYHEAKARLMEIEKRLDPLIRQKHESGKRASECADHLYRARVDMCAIRDGRK